MSRVAPAHTSTEPLVSLKLDLKGRLSENAVIRIFSAIGGHIWTFLIKPNPIAYLGMMQSMYIPIAYTTYYPWNLTLLRYVAPAPFTFGLWQCSGLWELCFDVVPLARMFHGLQTTNTLAILPALFLKDIYLNGDWEGPKDLMVIIDVKQQESHVRMPRDLATSIVLYLKYGLFGVRVFLYDRCLHEFEYACVIEDLLPLHECNALLFWPVFRLAHALTSRSCCGQISGVTDNSYSVHIYTEYPPHLRSMFCTSVLTLLIYLHAIMRGLLLCLSNTRSHDGKFKLFTQIICESLRVWIGEEILKICIRGILDALTCHECEKNLEVFLTSRSNAMITHYAGDARYAGSSWTTKSRQVRTRVTRAS
jgi:hypothetical protein